MATTIRQVVQDEICIKEGEIEELKTVLETLPREMLDIEADGIFLYGPRWYKMTDKSGNLPARLLSMGLEMWGKGRKSSGQSGMRISLYVPASDELGTVCLDIVQPGKDCRTVKVRITEEKTVSVCGELPPNYEILEILDETA